MRPRSRLARLLLFTAFACVLVGVAAYLVLDRLNVSPAPPEGCSVGNGGAGYDIDQAANASVIAAVGIRRGLPERAVTVALATAMQESKLRNLAPGEGDRDSVGLFQQRPSQGWGTAKEISDPLYAADRFYDALVKVPGYAKMSVADAAQQVQHSAYPQGYAQHVVQAEELSGALTGHDAAALSCVVRSDTAGTAKRARTQLQEEFGAAEGTVAVSGERLVIHPRDGRDGWALAQWAAVRAKSLGIERIGYAGRAWTLQHSADGWVADKSATGSVVLSFGAQV